MQARSLYGLHAKIDKKKKKKKKKRDLLDTLMLVKVIEDKIPSLATHTHTDAHCTTNTPHCPELDPQYQMQFSAMPRTPL